MNRSDAKKEFGSLEEAKIAGRVLEAAQIGALNHLESDPFSENMAYSNLVEVADADRERDMVSAVAAAIAPYVRDPTAVARAILDKPSDALAICDRLTEDQLVTISWSTVDMHRAKRACYAAAVEAMRGTNA